MIDITGIDKPTLLAALYNCANPGGAQSLGWLQWQPAPMTPEQAAPLVQEDWIDYLNGRALKIKIQGDELTSYLYDREYGEGAAQRIVDELRAEQQVAL